MIDHSNCEHERSKAARARCRRGVAPTTEEMNHGITPRDRENQCMVCTVEKIEFRGTDIFTGRLLYVGERCAYLVKRSSDFEAILP